MLSKLCHNSIDVPYLISIAEKKFLLGHKTTDLMRAALTEEQRFTVALVVLLEVERPLRFAGMSPREIEFITHYHGLIQEIPKLTKDTKQAVGAE